MAAVEHIPVLVEPALQALIVRRDGVYVDATFGRGGHSRAILERIAKEARLVAIDRDADAEHAALAIHDSRFTFVRAWFSESDAVLDRLSIDKIDGALFDLGISSPQIDEPSRGFSLRFEGPLDMRMDTSRGETAAQYLARVDARELTRVLRDFGEERFARRIAAAIVGARTREPLIRTRQLRELVAKVVGGRTRGDWRQDPATRTFQALRIQVNAELAELSKALIALSRRLVAGGRIAVISFHSLEDRIVKRFFARASDPFLGDERVAKLPIKSASLPAPPLSLVGRAIKPDAAECERNPRARSAVLRIAQRTGSQWPAALSNV